MINDIKYSLFVTAVPSVFHTSSSCSLRTTESELLIWGNSLSAGEGWDLLEEPHTGHRDVKSDSNGDIKTHVVQINTKYTHTHSIWLCCVLVCCCQPNVKGFFVFFFKLWIKQIHSHAMAHATLVSSHWAISRDFVLQTVWLIWEDERMGEFKLF